MTAPQKRLLIIFAITLAAEAGLAIVVKLGPAMAHLVRPVYVIVAAAGLFSAWHALKRHGRDRRAADRRQR